MPLHDLIRRACATAALLTPALGAALPPGYPVPFLPAQLYNEAPRPFASAVADFDGDGRPDVIALSDPALVGGSSPPALQVYVQSEPGRFQEFRSVALPYLPDAFSVADVNSDGRADALIRDDSRLSLFLQQPSGELGAAIELAGAQGMFGRVRLADVNGDGLIDVISTTFNQQSPVLRIAYQSVGDSGPRFDNTVDVASANSGWATEFADLNGDGRLDVIRSYGGTGADGSFNVVLQDATGAFGAERVYGPGSARYVAGGIATGDLNNDGLLDIAIAGGTSFFAGVGVFHQAPDGSFILARELSVGPNTGELAIADFDGDGWKDIVVTNNGYSSITVALLTPAADLAEARAFYVPQVRGGGADAFMPDALVVADVSNDGRPDVVLADPVEGQVVWFNSLGHVPTGDLRVAVVADPGVTEVGVARPFTVTAFNDGPHAMEDVVVLNLLPALYDFVAGTDCAPFEFYVLCELGELAPGTSRSTQFTAAARSSQAFSPADNTNVALVLAQTTDYNPANDIEETRVTATNTTQVGQIGFDQAAYSVSESVGEISIPVRRVNGSVDRVSVSISVRDLTTRSVEDYTGTVSTSYIWGDGDAHVEHLVLNIVPNSVDDGDRSFEVVLFGEGAPIGSIGRTVVTIVDDDSPAPAPGGSADTDGGGGGAFRAWLLALLAALALVRRRYRCGPIN